MKLFIACCVVIALSVAAIVYTVESSHTKLAVAQAIADSPVVERPLLTPAWRVYYANNEMQVAGFLATMSPEDAAAAKVGLRTQMIGGISSSDYIVWYRK